MPITLKVTHDWHLDFEQAKKLQEKLAKKVILTNSFGKLTCFAGIDVGYDSKDNKTHAAIILLDKNLIEIEKATATLPTTFPYVPGYLSFREVPAVIAALQKLEHIPDILFCDGQGYAHPRRFGIACHLGVLTDIPAIGIAKNRLIGEYKQPGYSKGNISDLYDHEIIGKVVRTRSNVKPVFVSPGHRIDFATAARLVLEMTTKYRLPEPTRLADKLSRIYSA